MIQSNTETWISTASGTFAENTKWKLKKLDISNTAFASPSVSETNIHWNPGFGTFTTCDFSILEEFYMLNLNAYTVYISQQHDGADPNYDTGNGISVFAIGSRSFPATSVHVYGSQTQAYWEAVPLQTLGNTNFLKEWFGDGKYTYSN
jgi:hypothetical protein